ncbi:MAG: fibronectin type III domain-containing protein [Acidimicrobiia bacterium]|nr:fibronectin type III domain-containing protein [Acidimicrobiia bacterium]
MARQLRRWLTVGIAIVLLAAACGTNRGGDSQSDNVPTPIDLGEDGAEQGVLLTGRLSEGDAVDSNRPSESLLPPRTGETTDRPSPAGLDITQNPRHWPRPPSAPNAPAGTSPSSGSIVWEWNCPLDRGAAITSFEFRWRLSGETSWRTSLTTTIPRLEQSGLTNGTAVKAQVRAKNSRGYSSWSRTGKATPAATAPDGGRTLALRADTGDTSGEIDLSWLEPDSGGAAIIKYEVQWRTAIQEFSFSRQLTTAQTTATVTSLANGTEYFFRVRAVNAQGKGAWSNEAAATPEPAQAIPDVANAPTGHAGQGVVRWTWNAPSDNGADISSYQFRLRQMDAVSWNTHTVNTPYYEASSLTNGQQYEAQVRATNSVGQQTSWSLSGSATPAAAVPDQVQAVAQANGPTGITATWGEPEANGDAIDNYTVQIATDSDFTVNMASHTQEDLDRTFTGLTEGTTYYVRVRPNNGAGNGSWSPTTSLAWDDGIDVPDALGAPVGSLAGSGAVRWRFGTDNTGGTDLTRYEFQVRTSGENWPSSVEQITPGDPSFLDSGHDGGTVRQTRVRAVGPGGTSDWSPTGSFTAATPPAAPTGVQLVARRPDPHNFPNYYQNGIRWTAPADGGSSILGYEVFGVVLGGGWLLYAVGENAVPAGTTELFSTTAHTGGSLTLLVRAFNAVGYGPWSD